MGYGVEHREWGCGRGQAVGLGLRLGLGSGGRAMGAEHREWGWGGVKQRVWGLSYGVEHREWGLVLLIGGEVIRDENTGEGYLCN